MTRVPDALAAALIQLIGRQARDLAAATYQEESLDSDAMLEIIQWENHLSQKIESDTSLDETDRRDLVLARRGQGIFKRNVLRIERRCRITGVDKVEHLIASHSKPGEIAAQRRKDWMAKTDCC